MDAAGAAGRRIGARFHVQALAGAGGMGAVYRAVDESDGATVALKVLGGDLRDGVERFLREAAVLASLDHPGIVRHVAHGRAEDGSPFLAMEWIEGEDLAERLARGPLSVQGAVTLVARMASALADVHARGIIHRDVKPSNIFLRGGSEDRPVLLDFGLARRTDASVALTRTGGVLGTPQYMAPEQVRGERDLGPAADVFSLGCVLFQCITGRPAFVGETVMAVLAKILLEDPPAASSLVPGVHPDLDALLRSMLGKDPADRPAGCATVAQALDEVALAATMAAPSAATASLGGRERRLISVVLARDVASAVDRTLSSEDIEDRRVELRRSVQEHGGRLAPLGSANVVVTVPWAASAVDQAASAARCARAVAASLPGARVAIAMGWAELDPTPVGEVIDRAARMLVARDDGAIVVDDVSADLLELRFDLGEEAGARTLGPERSSAEPPRALLGRATPCVGRDRELSVLAGLVTEVAEDGVARVALVTAPAGAGKSRLRHEVCNRIARDQPEATVLVARAEAFRANASLDMVGQLVRDAAGIRGDDAPAAARARLLARASAHCPAGRSPEDLAAFLGEIASVPFDDAASPRLAAARRDNRVIGELMLGAWTTWLGAELLARPVVLVFEDLHWADPQTVRYVDVALREHAEARLLVLALARPEVRTRFPSLWAERAPQEIALPPLTARASERLVRVALADLPAEDVERIVKQSEGNPLYLEELIRATARGDVDATPRSVIAMIQCRLEALDAGARRVVRAASVFGESFRPEDVRALVGDVATLDDDLELLVKREVLARRRADDRELAFRHALLREAAYATLTPEDRAHAHALAAAHLEAGGATDPIVLAEHLDLAADPERAARSYAAAAQVALHKNDFEAAVSRATAALARGGAAELRGAAIGARGKALACLGRWAEARRDLEEAVELTPLADGPRRIQLYEDLWLVATFTQDGELARRAGTEAMRIAGELGRADIAAEAGITLAVADHLEGDCEASLTRFRAAFASTRERPSSVVGLASILLYHVAEYAEGERVMRRMLGVATDTGDAFNQINLSGNLGLTLAGLGRYDEAEASFQSARALAERFGVQMLLARSVSMSSGYPLDVYDLVEAERRALETAEIGRRIEFISPRINASLDLAYVAVRRGDPERALALAADTGDAIAAGKGFHGWIWRSRLGVLHAEVLAAQGKWKDALALAEGCVHGCASLKRVKYRLLAEHVRARALVALGRSGEAVAAARATLEEARTFPDPAMNLRAAALLLDLDRDAAARDDLVAAASRIERALPTEAGRVAFRAGAPLHAAG